MNDDNVAELHPDSPIRRVTLEIEQHVAADGWDQGARLFALVSTEALLTAQPQLAEQLKDGADSAFTPIEQDPLPPQSVFEDVVQAIEWPASVDGCAVVLERLMLPPEAESDLPADPAELDSFVAGHPQRREVRLVAAVLRDGTAHSGVRSRGRDTADSELLEGPDLVPGLVRLIAATLDASR